MLNAKSSQFKVLSAQSKVLWWTFFSLRTEHLTLIL